MNKVQLAKTAATLIVGAGASGIVKDIIKYNTAPSTLTQKVTYAAGAVVLGSIVADVTRDYTSRKIDEGVALFNKHFYIK